MSKLYPGIYSPWLKSYNDVRALYKSLHLTAEKYGPPLTDADLREARRSARIVYRQPVHDPFQRPLTEAWRTHSNDNGETGVDYRILREDPNDPWTYEELAEYVHNSEVYYGRGYHDFDCSGDRFTYGWTYKRTPAGIVLVHHWGTDI